MATTILDALKQQSAEQAKPQGAGSTARLQQILSQTSGSAAAQAPKQPAQNLLEEGALADAAQQGKQAQAASDIAAGGIEQKGEQVAAAASTAQAAGNEKVERIKQQAANKSAQLLSDYQQEQGALSLDQKKAKAEQLGFNMRLANQQYISRLQQEGAVRRLGDKNGFEEATANAVMGDELKLLKDHTDWQEAMTQDEMGWWEQMQNIDLDTWMQMASLQSKQAGATQTAQGIQSAVEGGAKIYANSGSKTPPAGGGATANQEADAGGTPGYNGLGG